MEREDRNFKRRYERSFKLAYDYEFTASEREQRIGVYIPSRIKPNHETCQIYQVYEFGPGILRAIMPLKKSKNLDNQFSFLTVLQKADDCWLLTFPEERLDEVADAMKLRRRRRLSSTEREKAVRNLRKFKKKDVANDE
jgi:hypothetical protein